MDAIERIGVSAMNDFFIEKIVRRNKGTLDHVMRILTVLSALIIIVLLNIVPMYFGLNVLMITALISIVPGYVAYNIFLSLDIEYEYCLTNDEFSIDKIIAKRKRKHLFNANCKDFKEIASVSDDSFLRLPKNKKKIIDYSSGSNSDQLWYFSIRHEGIEKAILFDYDERLISVFRRFNPRSFIK